MRRVPSVLCGRVIVSVALMLAPLVAHAQRVVLLDFSGDHEGRLREQVQTAIVETGRVHIVPRAELEEAVEANNGYLGWTLTLMDVQPVAAKLGVSTVVTATVDKELELSLFDASGTPLWSKRLPLEDGRLSSEHAERLGSAIVVAARLGRHRGSARSPARDTAAARPSASPTSSAPPPSATPDATDGSAANEASDASDPEHQAALAEVAASREAARKRRQEARILERRARAVERAEAEREELERKEAQIRRRLEKAAARYEAERTRHEAEMARERESFAQRRADALKERDDASRRLDDLNGGKRSERAAPRATPSQSSASPAPGAGGASAPARTASR